ncbi:hypothetical protein [Clostridium estertheticum]|uniref:hypothetical protein n=1 Tax=Clostridium estertheticum TaxID=238834 RepID=UPI001CF4A34A|nr:hypothetical protein [Clostridium estertheticum]MCB2360901.1 hypothetical protein [Clostridium estertheticum]
MNKLMKTTILSSSLVTVMAGAAVLIIFFSLLSGKLTEKFTKKSILIVVLIF